MKPFNLELAKQGKPVCTREGRKARIICFDSKIQGHPIVALVACSDNTETPRSYTAKGGYMDDSGPQHSWDLVMATVREKRWIAVDVKGEHLLGGRKVNIASHAFYSREDVEEYCRIDSQIIEIEIEV